MKMISKVALAAVGALALSAGAASAEIVCNDDGDCWHVRHHMDYPAGIRLHVHCAGPTNNRKAKSAIDTKHQKTTEKPSYRRN
jgi:hypothetical protein